MQLKPSAISCYLWLSLPTSWRAHTRKLRPTHEHYHDLEEMKASNLNLLEIYKQNNKTDKTKKVKSNRKPKPHGALWLFAT